MSADEKGRRFLELIDKQHDLQWNIVANLHALIKSEWDSVELQNELEALMDDHTKITKELNSLDLPDGLL